MSFHVDSEVGKLRKVIVHRPGLEHTRLTPSNAEDLLFDDVIWVKRAKEEHDAFCEVMRDRGVEVFYAEELLADVLGIPEAREWVLDQVLDERHVGVYLARSRREWGRERDAGGGRRLPDRRPDEVRPHRRRGADLRLQRARPTCCCRRCRTSSSSATRRRWIYDGVTLNPMTKPARRPETVFMEAIYRWHPMFAAERRRQGVARRRRAGLGPGHRRGRRRHADRQRRRDDRHGRAHGAAGRDDDRPRAVQGRLGAARARRDAAALAALHAPRHRDDDGRPRRGHAVPGRGRRRARVVDPPGRRSRPAGGRAVRRRRRRRPQARARAGRASGSSRPAATRSGASASSGTTATTSSAWSRASSSPTTATSTPTPACARRASRSSPSTAPSSGAAAAARTA